MPAVLSFPSPDAARSHAESAGYRFVTRFLSSWEIYARAEGSTLQIFSALVGDGDAPQVSPVTAMVETASALLDAPANEAIRSDLRAIYEWAEVVVGLREFNQYAELAFEYAVASPAEREHIDADMRAEHAAEARAENAWLHAAESADMGDPRGW